MTHHGTETSLHRIHKAKIRKDTEQDTTDHAVITLEDKDGDTVHELVAFGENISIELDNGDGEK